MSAIVVLLAVIMAVIISWLVRQTINAQPWVPEVGVPTGNDDNRLNVSDIKLGLVVFLAVATSVFALFISAYLMRMEAPDWRVLEDPDILWANTLVLIAASIFYQRAHSAAKQANLVNLRNGLIAAGAFTFIFLIGQLEAWRQLNEAGYYLSVNPANAFFYLFTALHGIHLLGGLWVWCKTMFKIADATDNGEVSRSVELCTIYWHFLLVVWLVLLALFQYT